MQEARCFQPEAEGANLKIDSTCHGEENKRFDIIIIIIIGFCRQLVQQQNGNSSRENTEIADNYKKFKIF